MIKIKYNEKENTIEINDGLQSYFVLVKFLMILILINSIINLFDIGKNGFGLLEIVWIFLGLIAVIVLYSLFIKETSLEKVPVGKIKRVNEEILRGKKTYSLQLVNGKKRILKDIKTDKEFKEFQKLLKKAGIEN
jgi:hypothetical protein